MHTLWQHGSRHCQLLPTNSLHFCIWDDLPACSVFEVWWYSDQCQPSSDLCCLLTVVVARARCETNESRTKPFSTACVQDVLCVWCFMLRL